MPLDYLYQPCLMYYLQGRIRLLQVAMLRDLCFKHSHVMKRNQSGHNKTTGPKHTRRGIKMVDRVLSKSAPKSTIPHNLWVCFFSIFKEKARKTFTSKEQKWYASMASACCLRLSIRGEGCLAREGAVLGRGEAQFGGGAEHSRQSGHI